MKERSAIRKQFERTSGGSESDCTGAKPIGLATYCVLSMARRIECAIEVLTIGEPGWQRESESAATREFICAYSRFTAVAAVCTGGRASSQ